jgi:phage terminase large subunit-like protein
MNELNLDLLSYSERQELLVLLSEDQRRLSRRRLERYDPYPKQLSFHNAGKTHRERLFMAGNQVGKTLGGAAEAAIHLTGNYPDWWDGRRWDRPIRGLAGSESSELTRKGVQRLLLGPPEDESQWGTGYIPGDSIIKWSKRHGVPNAVESISVRHVTGGASVISFPSYDQGRSKWQADTVDLVWFDEEPPDEIYSEGLTRTNATRGMVFMTFTPLKGMSAVVSRFLLESNAARHVTQMELKEAKHYTADQIAEIEASYKPHEIEARTKGTPILGSGRVFPIEEERIKCDPFPIPAHYAQLGAMDFGWDHPFAAVKMAWDRENDVIYVVEAYRVREEVPLVQAAAIKPWGRMVNDAQWLPWAWPHDGLQHDKGSGEQLATQYRAQGLRLLEKHATFEDGSNGFEAGLMEMYGRMRIGKLKVFAHLGEWFEEFRLYHRKDGQVVKLRDDLMSATRVGIMCKRFARQMPADGMRRPRFANMDD